MRRFVIVLALLTLGADPDAARDEQQAGVEAYQEGRFDAAAAAFRAAYELDPKPIYLFSWGQSEVARGDCVQAIAVFERYLETDPPEQNRAAAVARIDTCRAQQPAPEPPPPAPVPEPAPPRPAPTMAPPPPTPAPTFAAVPAPPPPARPPPTRWFEEPLGMTLLTVGLVATGAGVGVLAWAQSHASAANEQRLTRYDEHAAALDDARTGRIAGGILTGVGLAAMAGGVIRAVTWDGDASGELGLWIGPATLHLAGGF